MSETQEPLVDGHVIQNIPLVALVGAPNSGKTTLYNWLTGANAKAVNYPGSTVDYLKGELAAHWKQNKSFVLDTPGTYSLHAKSEDELVTQKILTSTSDDLTPSYVIVVLDGTQLNRHLLLAEQIRQMGMPMVLAITMADLLRSKNIELNLEPLKKHFKCPVMLVDGRLGGGIRELIEVFPSDKIKIPFNVKNKDLQNWAADELDSHGKWADQMAHEVFKKSESLIPGIWTNTLRWDRLFLHPVGGTVSFLVIMTVLFSSIYYLAAPMMEQVDALFAFLSTSLLSLGSENLLVDFLANGIVTSFGAVLIFVPQIFILFVGMGFLESSGYLSRAATLIDRPFSRVGLSGRSFVPFLSGYACAVPALMAARNISASRERWIARFIIPLMSCSARLPVYGILLALIFAGQAAWIPGLTLAAIYIGSMVVSALAAGVLNKIIPQDRKSFFLMELPLYRTPIMKVVLTQAWMKTKSFITRAGPVIFILTVILWVGTTFPNYQANDSQKIQSSYLGQMGQKIEPLFEPMGLDWRGGVSLLAAFAAREVFVSTLAMVYNIADEEQEAGLMTAMKSAQFPDGRPIFTFATMVGLIFFFMVALQCLSTVGIMIKESNSVKLAIIQLVVFNVIAYVGAVVLVQGLRAFGIA